MKNEAQNLLASYNTYPSKIKAQIWFLNKPGQEEFQHQQTFLEKKGISDKGSSPNLVFDIKRIHKLLWPWNQTIISQMLVNSGPGNNLQSVSN